MLTWKVGFRGGVFLFRKEVTTADTRLVDRDRLLFLIWFRNDGTIRFTCRINHPSNSHNQCSRMKLLGLVQDGIYAHMHSTPSQKCYWCCLWNRSNVGLQWKSLSASSVWFLWLSPPDHWQCDTHGYEPANTVSRSSTLQTTSHSAQSFPLTLACPGQYIYRSLQKWMPDIFSCQSGLVSSLFVVVVSSLTLWELWHV